MASQYLVLHLIHRGALWASGAAQAAQFVRIILRWRGALRVTRRRVESSSVLQAASLRSTLRDLNEAVATYEDIERVWLRRFGENHLEMLSLRGELGEVREERDRLQEESDKATMMALAFVAALAFLAGRRYLRR